MQQPMPPTSSGPSVYDFEAPPAVPPDEQVRLLGGKGANLAVMASELGLPVPPGFTITTHACLEYLANGWPAGLDAELSTAMERLADRVGRRFGDVRDPLLVSVRSGAPVSMPGMMDTILDLGLNDATTAGLARSTRSADFAADCLRRFRDGYRAVTGAIEVPDDPWDQLRAAIEAVFRSWNGERAAAYRRREAIPDSMGTAATVQAMVFGNRGAHSGTGVLFTRNPSTGEATLYGEVLFEAQGEDVVAGTHQPVPLSVLDRRQPAVAAELRRHAHTLERHYADVCDIEFTIEQGRLWLLQVRVAKRSPKAALRVARDMAQDADFPLSREQAVRRVARYLASPPRTFVAVGEWPAPLTVGLPASPGVASGTIVTSSEAAAARAAGGTAVILVRPETAPEDVGGMARSAGVLTARGGVTSHAAVVARGWGIPAVVGAADLEIEGSAVRINGRQLAAGASITIDGGTGGVYEGELAGRREELPEVATLRGWADELGIRIESVAATPVFDVPQPAGPADVDAEDLQRTLLIRGTASVDQLADILAMTPEDLALMLDQLAGLGLASTIDGTWRLTASGKLGALALMAADRSRLGEECAAGLLEQFDALDRRMKQVVTSWQLREVDGEQVINDHADPAYDRKVLAELGALDTDTADWLGPLVPSLPRLGAYRTRLCRALDLATGGDGRFVASPRVDSYHGVWFELHEDLLRLAGRQREA
jgi:pyruvate,orthophosphate dikinase